MSKQKLELMWVGKEKRAKLEPRILIEDPEKSYHADKRVSDNDIFDNMLIHGDNLLALKALEQDYAGRVKCIYIDPPYNTGNAFEHYDDGLEHSIWLSLMRERLELLKNLLREDGILFVQIDDSEQAYLKVLLDEIFGRVNFINTLPTVMNLKGNQDQFGFAGTHEYILCYAKNKGNTILYSLPIEKDIILSEWEEDDIGLFKKGATLKATGADSPREKRPSMFFPILINKLTNKISLIEQNEYEKIYKKDIQQFDDDFLKKIIKKYSKLGFEVILPMDDANNFTRWRWGWNNDTFKKLQTEVIVVSGKKGFSLYKKQRPELNEIPTKKPKTIFYKPEYSSGNGTAQIKKLFGGKVFDYPKPEELICDLLIIGSNPGDLVLDSFLGSGTTAAVAHKMGRKWIGIELGEHCDTHCVPRLKKVIDGEDAGGITKSANWRGGGGFRYYNLAPSLVKFDEWGNPVINKEFNENMLVRALCKVEGFNFDPSPDVYWKQGKSTESDFIYVTTQHLTAQMLQKLSDDVGDSCTLLICCGSFDGKKDSYGNLTIKKIPKAILKKCEWNHDDYSLEIKNLPMSAPDPQPSPAPRKKSFKKLPSDNNQLDLF